MEWLINRRRMMCHESVPPVYLAFEDPEVWRICCINYGDYIETVITNNGDNTVNIVRRFRSVIMSSNQRSVTTKKLDVLETQTNVDNSEGTYTAGTTKEPVGITQRQCDAITNLGYWNAGVGITNLFINNSKIKSGNDLIHFRNMTELYGNWNSSKYGGFKGCTNLETAEIPESLKTIGAANFYHCNLQHFDFKNVTTVGRQSFEATKLEEAVFNEGFTTLHTTGSNYGAFTKISTLKYVDFPSTTTRIGGQNFRHSHPVLVCRATTPPTLETYNTGPTAVYVPAESVEAYKAATNWSAMASKIQAIEGTWYETHRELEPTT